jgi:predicted RNase H-like HicB family nuclease
MAKYTVVCEQDEDGWWVGKVKEVAGVLTQGRSLATIKKRIRDALSLAVDDAAKADLVLDVKLPAQARKAVEKLREAQERSDREQARALELARRAARELAKAMSVRDAGEVLHVTGQRVQQLVEADG